MFDRGAVVAEDLGDADLVQGDVGRAEGVRAESPGGVPGLANQVVGGSPVAVYRCGIGGDLQ